MSIQTSGNNMEGLLPTKYNDLIVGPITDESIPFTLGTSVRLDALAHDLTVPMLTKDVSAYWTAEGEEIPDSDPEFDSLTITPSKISAFSSITREAVQDVSPESTSMVGESISRSLVDGINATFVGTRGENQSAPQGLEDVEGVNEITHSLTNLDAFSAAIAHAELEGGQVTAFLADPQTALALAQLKSADGSNGPLLPDPRVVQGRPVVVNRHVAAGTVWAIDQRHVLAVIANQVEVAFSDSVYFSSDRTAIRGVARIGFGYTRPSVFSKIEVVPSGS